MTGETYDLSAQFFNVIKDTLASIGKNLDSREEGQLANFLRPGIRKLQQSDSYDYIMEVERKLISRIRSVASPKMSLDEILRKLCPLDPIC